jgi:ATP-dependent protease ClpP protease subunit
MTLIYDYPIERDEVCSFIKTLEESVKTLKQGEKINIYFSTDGGYVMHVHPLVESILRNKDKLNFHITSVMESAGSLILDKLSEIPIKMTDSFLYSMVHKVSSDVKNSEYVEEVINSDNYLNSIFLKILKKYTKDKTKLEKFENFGEVKFFRSEVLKAYKNITTC